MKIDELGKFLLRQTTALPLGLDVEPEPIKNSDVACASRWWHAS